MSDIWDPERIRIVGSVLERYSAHLAPGHRIRCGMEGDESSVYRSTSDAPTATVLEVFREPNGYVKFRAQMDSSGAIVDFDNRNIAPGAIWEIEPDYLETFRGHVERSLEGGSAVDVERLFKEESKEVEEDAREEAEDEAEDEAEEEAEEEAREDAREEAEDDAAPRERFEEYRSSVISEMDEKLRDQELRLRSEFGSKSAMDAEFKETMAETVRMLSEDMIRLAKGKPLQFSERYADKYDDAMHEKEGSEVEEFRGSSKSSSSKRSKREDEDKHQNEKTDFDMEFVSPVTYKDDFQKDPAELTDDEDN